jgi:O-antigen/teichoic acid export membrane protein
LRDLVLRAREAWKIGGVREFARGGLTGIVANSANRLFTIGSAVILARMLGSEGYGIYATAIASMMILAVLAEFGMYVLLVREVSAAHARGAWGELMGFGVSAARFSALMAALVAVAGGAVIWLTPMLGSAEEKVALTLMLALLPINTLYRLGAAMLYGLRRVAAAQVAEQFLLPATSFSFFAAMYVLASKQASASQVMLAQILAGSIALTIVGVMIYRALAPARELGASVVPAERFQARALPFLVMGAAGTITLQIDTVIVSAMMGNSETALYRVASQAAMLTWFGIQILQAIAQPFFARLYQQGDMANLKRLYHWTTVLAVASAAPVLVIFILFGRPLIAFVFGPEFVGAQPMMIVLSAGYLINVMCGPAGGLLAMTGEERWASRAYLVMSALAVLIALSLVRPLGPIGVALGTAFGTAGYHIVLRFHTRRRLGF